MICYGQSNKDAYFTGWPLLKSTETGCCTNAETKQKRSKLKRVLFTKTTSLVSTALSARSFCWWDKPKVWVLVKSSMIQPSQGLLNPKYYNYYCAEPELMLTWEWFNGGTSTSAWWATPCCRRELRYQVASGVNLDSQVPSPGNSSWAYCTTVTVVYLFSFGAISIPVVFLQWPFRFLGHDINKIIHHGRLFKG